MLMEEVDAVAVATSTTTKSQERRTGSQNRERATLAATNSTLLWWDIGKGFPFHLSPWQREFLEEGAKATSPFK